MESRAEWVKVPEEEFRVSFPPLPKGSRWQESSFGLSVQMELVFVSWFSPWGEDRQRMDYANPMSSERVSMSCHLLRRKSGNPRLEGPN